MAARSYSLPSYNSCKQLTLEELVAWIRLKFLSNIHLIYKTNNSNNWAPCSTWLKEVLTWLQGKSFLLVSKCRKKKVAFSRFPKRFSEESLATQLCVQVAPFPTGWPYSRVILWCMLSNLNTLRDLIAGTLSWTRERAWTKLAVSTMRFDQIIHIYVT